MNDFNRRVSPEKYYPGQSSGYIETPVTPRSTELLTYPGKVNRVHKVTFPDGETIEGTNIPATMLAKLEADGAKVIATRRQTQLRGLPAGSELFGVPIEVRKLTKGVRHKVYAYRIRATDPDHEVLMEKLKTIMRGLDEESIRYTDCSWIAGD